MDHETIKAEFLRKVHHKNPPFRYKLKPKPRICAEIPPMVEHLYKHPPPLLPSLRDVLRYEKVFKRTTASDPSNEMLCSELEKQIHHFKKAKQTLESIENEIITPKIEEDNDVQIIEEKTNEIIVKDTDEPMHVDEIKEEINDDGAENVKEVKSELEKQTSKTNENIDADIGKIDTAPENKKLDNEKIDLDTQNDEDKTVFNNNNSNSNAQIKRKRMISTKGLSVEFDDFSLLAFKDEECDKINGIMNDESIEKELSSLDMSIIKRLAFQQLQHILTENPALVTRLQTQRADKEIYDELKVKPKKIVLPSQLLTKEDITKIAKQFASPDISFEKKDDTDDKKPLQNGKPLTIIPPNSNFIYTNGLDHIEGDTEKALAIARRLEAPISASKIRARAVLTPVGDILSGKRLVWLDNI